MSGTTFLSDCYLPIFQPNPYGELERYTDLWRNFMAGRNTSVADWYAENRIKEWNGTLIKDAVVFASEADKMWFILRWS